jgi:hypothetical protein
MPDLTTLLLLLFIFVFLIFYKSNYEKKKGKNENYYDKYRKIKGTISLVILSLVLIVYIIDKIING